MANTITIENVVKRYPGSDAAAVDGISLDVAQGEIVTLLGPSGCGKTTMLRLIAGFERPDSGSIRFGDRVVAGSGAWVPPEQRGVGMVFQEHALFPHLTAADNIGFNMKTAEKSARVEEVLELVGLGGLGKRMPHELSGGQQQRVALARALARKPAVVLLDEPFSSLDADLRVHMRREIRRILVDAQATALFVSHDQTDALAISDTVVVMRNGRIEQAGSPREVYQYPETRFVADFVGRSNILEGVIGADCCSIDTALGKLPCEHTHDRPGGSKVAVSVRADSLELDTAGPISGKVIETTYTGRSIDAVVQVELPSGGSTELLIHAHPEQVVNTGDIVCFRVLPDFVAVIER
jgi:iron(III) transport system ATP-binding protein